MSKLVLGLCGPEGAGKSTAANAIRTYFPSVEVIPFARPLKKMMAALGVPERNLYGNDNDKTEALPILGGFSARVAMQLLGTEWGRKLDQNLWVRAWQNEVRQSRARVVVADDVRFQNEVDAIRQIGGHTLCIVRSSECWRRVPRHASEAFQALRFDDWIANDGDEAALGKEVSTRVRDLFYPKAHHLSA